MISTLIYNNINRYYHTATLYAEITSLDSSSKSTFPSQNLKKYFQLHILATLMRLYTEGHGMWF